MFESFRFFGIFGYTQVIWKKLGQRPEMFPKNHNGGRILNFCNLSLEIYSISYMGGIRIFANGSIVQKYLKFHQKSVICPCQKISNSYMLS